MSTLTPSGDHTGDPAQYLRIGRIMSVDRAAATCLTPGIGTSGSDGIKVAGGLSNSYSDERKTMTNYEKALAAVKGTAA